MDLDEGKADQKDELEVNYSEKLALQDSKLESESEFANQ